MEVPDGLVPTARYDAARVGEHLHAGKTMRWKVVIADEALHDGPGAVRGMGVDEQHLDAIVRESLGHQVRQHVLEIALLVEGHDADRYQVDGGRRRGTDGSCCHVQRPCDPSLGV